MDEETRMIMHYLGSDPMSDYYRERIADAFRKEEYRRDRDAVNHQRIDLPELNHLTQSKSNTDYELREMAHELSERRTRVEPKQQPKKPKSAPAFRVYTK